MRGHKTNEPRQVRASITETRLSATVFGTARIADDGGSAILNVRGVPEEYLSGVHDDEFGKVGIIPFVEGNAVVGAYLVDVGRLEQGEHEREIRAPVLLSSPFFFLSSDHQREIGRIVRHIAETDRHFFLCPERRDSTSDIRDKLRNAFVVWKGNATEFDLKRFIDAIHSAEGQEGFENIFKVTLGNGETYILSIDRHVASVVDLSPVFLKINANRAVRLAYDGNDNTWLAPFTSSRSKVHVYAHENS